MEQALEMSNLKCANKQLTWGTNIRISEIVSPLHKAILEVLKCKKKSYAFTMRSYVHSCTEPFYLFISGYDLYILFN